MKIELRAEKLNESNEAESYSNQETTEKDFNNENKTLGVSKIFIDVEDVRAIAHQIQVLDGQISIFTTANEGYNQRFQFLFNLSKKKTVKRL